MTTVTHRENALAILNYEKYEKMPVVSFGYWHEALDKWAAEGHITEGEAQDYRINGVTARLTAQLSILDSVHCMIYIMWLTECNACIKWLYGGEFSKGVVQYGRVK